MTKETIRIEFKIIKHKAFDKHLEEVVSYVNPRKSAS